MKLPTYTSTPGLDRFPVNDRLTIYRATHKRLLKEDANYRRRWISYLATIVFSAAIPASGYFVRGMLGISLLILSVLLLSAAILCCASRQQNFMNQRIGDALQSPPDKM